MVTHSELIGKAETSQLLGLRRTIRRGSSIEGLKTVDEMGIHTARPIDVVVM